MHDIFKYGIERTKFGAILGFLTTKNITVNPILIQIQWNSSRSVQYSHQNVSLVDTLNKYVPQIFVFRKTWENLRHLGVNSLKRGRGGYYNLQFDT